MFQDSSDLKSLAQSPNDSLQLEKQNESPPIVCCQSLLSSTLLESALEQRHFQSDEGTLKDNSSLKEVRFASSISIISNPPLLWTPEDAWHNISYYIRYWNLDFFQGNALEDLRNTLYDVNHPHNRPGVVIRFLRTQKYHVDKAEQMFRKSLQWREEYQVDSIIQDYEPPQELVLKYPGAILKGRDKDGDPVFLSRMGVTDLSGMLRKFGHDEMLRYEIYKREAATTGSWLMDWEEESQRPIRQILIIEDLQGLSRKVISSHIASFYGETMHLDQANYPDTAKKIIIIRTPIIFRMVWSIVKHFFGAHIVEKMEFAGSHNYLQVLEKYIDLEILPSCILPKGNGEAASGMSSNFQGGEI